MKLRLLGDWPWIVVDKNSEFVSFEVCAQFCQLLFDEWINVVWGRRKSLILVHCDGHSFCVVGRIETHSYLCKEEKMDGNGNTKAFYSCRNSEVAAKKREMEQFVNSKTYMWNGPSANNFKLEKAPSTIRYIPNFITEEEEKFFLSEIYAVPKPKWQQLLNRRLQNWGGVVGKEYLIPDNNIPPWLKFIIDKLMTVGDSFPADRRPNHVLINEYLPGQGIMAHTDGPAFYPMVATVSLGGDVLVDYYKPLDAQVNHIKEERYLGSMFLERRSLILLSDDAYTNCLHEIADRSFDVITRHIFNLEGINKHIGEVLNRDLRVSLTIRNVPKVSKLTAADLVMKR